MPAGIPAADKAHRRGGAAVVVAALGLVVRERAVREREGIRPKSDAAVGRIDPASQGGADVDHRTTAGVAVAADGLVVVEGAVGDVDDISQLSANRTALGISGLDDVGPGGGGVIAADGLVVTEAAIGDRQADARQRRYSVVALQTSETNLSGHTPPRNTEQSCAGFVGDGQCHGGVEGRLRLRQSVQEQLAEIIHLPDGQPSSSKSDQS